MGKIYNASGDLMEDLTSDTEPEKIIILNEEQADFIKLISLNDRRIYHFNFKSTGR